MALCQMCIRDRTYTIVPDTTAPQISGITQDKIYCGAVTATVTDKNLKEVTVDGNKVTLQDNKFTVSPKKGVQKIEASDKSGNKTTVSITVNKMCIRDRSRGNLGSIPKFV